jgi:hypothetical protein
MIYVTNSVAAVWSGLLSITENPVGGDAAPIYYEGRKVRNPHANEVYQGTVEALYPPAEFAPCAGKLQLSPGLYAANQPKAWFNFSYRTMIGNDLSGAANYKLHLVYNCTVQSVDFTYTTINAAMAATPHSWNIFTVPLAPTGYRPTAHFVLDSRYVSAFSLARLESMLYGDDNSDPHMPTLNEVISVLTGVFDVTWWNLTGLDDFPEIANVGDMGVDFSDDTMYADQLPDNDAYWWDITGGDFPAQARIGDWGIDTSTGQVWQNLG